MRDLGVDCMLLVNGALLEDGPWQEDDEFLSWRGLEQARMCPLHSLLQGVGSGLRRSKMAVHLARLRSH
jgi:hypothetical protein